MSTKIEWATHTENPFHGCKHGCPYCYARKFAARLAGNEKSGGMYRELAARGMDPFTPAIDVRKLDDMIQRLKAAKKPRRVFLGSMGDLGGNWDWMDLDGSPISAHSLRVAVATAISRILYNHTFLLLTKNPAGFADVTWGRNCQIGVSVTNSAEARERVRILTRGVPCYCKRWVSIEPLLDPQFDPESVNQLGVDWIVIGAQTGRGSPVPMGIIQAAKRIVKYYSRRAIPVFVKDNIVKLDPAYQWPREII